MKEMTANLFSKEELEAVKKRALGEIKALFKSMDGVPIPPSHTFESIEQWEKVLRLVHSLLCESF